MLPRAPALHFLNLQRDEGSNGYPNDVHHANKLYIWVTFTIPVLTVELESNKTAWRKKNKRALVINIAANAKTFSIHMN